MNDRRSLLVAVSCPSAVMVGWLALSLSAYAPAVIENSGANAAAVSRAKNVSRLELAVFAIHHDLKSGASARA